MIQNRLKVNKSLNEKALKNIDPYSFLLFGMFTAISSPRSLIGSPRKELRFHGNAWQFDVTTSRAIVVLHFVEGWHCPNLLPLLEHFSSKLLEVVQSWKKCIWYFKNLFVSVFRCISVFFRYFNSVLYGICVSGVGRGREPTDPSRIFFGPS